MYYLNGNKMKHTNLFAKLRFCLLVIAILGITSCGSSGTQTPSSLQDHIRIVFNNYLATEPGQVVDNMKKNKDKILDCAYKEMTGGDEANLDINEANKFYEKIKNYKIEDLNPENSVIFGGLDLSVVSVIGKCTNKF